MTFFFFLIIFYALLFEADGSKYDRNRNGSKLLQDNKQTTWWSQDTLFSTLRLKTDADTDTDPSHSQRALNNAADQHIASSIRNGVHSVTRTDDDKKEAKREKLEKVKALRVAETEASPFKLTLKGDGKEPDVGTEGNNQIETNIVGGQQSDQGEFPYYVDMVICGGTLIAPDVVLGAAHCGGFIGQTVYVSGYQHGTDTYGAIPVRVVAQFQNPNYNEATSQNDFFLYQLEEEIFLDSQVTLSLNDDISQPFDGQELTVLGLGLLSDGGFTPGFLNDVVVSTMSNDYCASSESYGSEYYSDVMFCAGDSSADSCQGDSGGPIVVRDGNNHILVGVVSWGYGCAEPNYPGIYARVSSAMPWIESVVCDTWNSNANFCPNRPVGDCVMLELDFKTDDYPDETSFTVQDSQQDFIMDESYFDYGTDYHYETCIEANSCATLRFNDSFGDGLLGDGYLRVTWDNGVIFEDWDIGFGVEYELSTGGCGYEPGDTSTMRPSETQNPETCELLTVELRTDLWPEETFIVLQNDDDGRIWDFSGYDGNTEYSYTACIPYDSCTLLDVTDVYGDGLLNDGYIRVTLGSTTLYDDWNIGFGFILEMGTGCSI